MGPDVESTKEPSEAEKLAAQHAQTMSDYQAMMDKNMRDYKDLVAKAHSDLEALVSAGQPTPPVVAPKPALPECEWTEANGQQFLVMNTACADFFTEIFKQVGVLATELGKSYTKK